MQRAGLSTKIFRINAASLSTYRYSSSTTSPSLIIRGLRHCPVSPAAVYGFGLESVQSGALDAKRPIIDQIDERREHGVAEALQASLAYFVFRSQLKVETQIEPGHDADRSGKP
jgi:hypothetical protein